MQPFWQICKHSLPAMQEEEEDKYINLLQLKLLLLFSGVIFLTIDMLHTLVCLQYFVVNGWIISKEKRYKTDSNSYFNVETDVVVDRIICSLNPVRDDFFSKIDANPDLTTTPPLPFSLLCKFFFLVLNCVFTGISYNSHTLGSAMSNLTLTITFLLAIIFSQEVYPFSNCIKRYKATRHYSKHVRDTG
ncbi:hypothetical protein Ahy_B08g091655 isoform A [Arachis hypogaea]|uniref:Uncharacterized protein n=1 Tax=Arachis hypogaea TaxID=3818 RepID=A0A444Y2H0_ARAHY|nr:hypothetical protein Ahy_B08g091655 isoform A [Arachis hypogaea]